LTETALGFFLMCLLLKIFNKLLALTEHTETEVAKDCGVQWYTATMEATRIMTEWQEIEIWNQ